VKTINIEIETSLGRNDIIDRVSGTLMDIEDRFGIEGHWNEGKDTYTFDRSGLEGQAVIQDGCVTVDIELGVLLGAFKSKIEDELRSQLEAALEE
jgi:putative polyhydroxyalkanoate system protein